MSVSLCRFSCARFERWHPHVGCGNVEAETIAIRRRGPRTVPGRPRCLIDAHGAWTGLPPTDGELVGDVIALPRRAHLPAPSMLRDHCRASTGFFDSLTGNNRPPSTVACSRKEETPMRSASRCPVPAPDYFATASPASSAGRVRSPRPPACSPRAATSDEVFNSTVSARSGRPDAPALRRACASYDIRPVVLPYRGTRLMADVVRAARPSARRASGRERPAGPRRHALHLRAREWFPRDVPDRRLRRHAWHRGLYAPPLDIHQPFDRLGRTAVPRAFAHGVPLRTRPRPRSWSSGQFTPQQERHVHALWTYDAPAVPLRALAAAGHGSKILLADANYPHTTGVGSRGAKLISQPCPGSPGCQPGLDVLARVDRGAKLTAPTPISGGRSTTSFAQLCPAWSSANFPLGLRCRATRTSASSRCDGRAAPPAAAACS